MQSEKSKVAPVHEAGHFVLHVLLHGTPPHKTRLYGDDNGYCLMLANDGDHLQAILTMLAGYAATAYQLEPVGMKSQMLNFADTEDYYAVRKIYEDAYGPIVNEKLFHDDMLFRYGYVQFLLDMHWDKVCEVAEILEEKREINYDNALEIIKRGAPMDKKVFVSRINKNEK